MKLLIVAMMGLFLGISGRALAQPNITAIVNGVAYGCGLPAPEYKLYCSCQTSFGQTALYLMAFDPQTAQEKRVRELAKFSGSAVHPGIEHCRAAIKNQEFAECGQ